MLLTKGLSVRFSNVLITALLVFLVFHATRHVQQRQRGTILIDLADDVVSSELSPEEEYLERLIDTYGLTNETRWQAWRIQPSERDEEGSTLTDVHVNFESGAEKVINLRQPSRADLHAAKMMALPIRSGGRIEETDASEFLFGISTTYERLADRDWAVLRAWERWLTKGKKRSNGAGLVLTLDKATPEQLQQVDQMLHDVGIDAYTMATDEPMSMARRYYELVRILKTYSATLAASGQRKRWYGIVEDTVFFPSITHLQARLAGYETNEPLFIGLPSEREDWREEDSSLTTSGGGAVLLTREAVAAIPRLPCLEVEDTEKPVRPKKWDSLLRDCVKNRAGLDMHVIPAFYSPSNDVAEGEPRRTASHETGVRPLVLHDYQNRHRLDVGMSHLVTDICGEACFMQRYVFHDDWVLINGVSISQHPDGLVTHHRHYDFFGKHDEDEPSEESDAPPRPRKRVSGQIVIDDSQQGLGRTPALVWTGRRNLWRLLDSATSADGAVWQAYLKRGARKSSAVENDPADEMDSVIVLIWENNTR